ncbi:hypothetical protein [Bordetella petrii]|uniref:hypothetical protein n=1 Tax=Bordetella petrii TaxID=94624 RepID=UPI003733C569
MNENSPQPSDFDDLGISVDALDSLAESAGLRAPPEALMAFALAIAEQCAEIGDHYTVNGKNCGDEIRTRFGLG